MKVQVPANLPIIIEKNASAVHAVIHLAFAAAVPAATWFWWGSLHWLVVTVAVVATI